MTDSQICLTSGVHTRRFLKEHAIFSMVLRGEQEYGGQWFEYRMTCAGCNRGCSITFTDTVPESSHFEPFVYAETVAAAHYSLCKKLAQAAEKSVPLDGQNRPMSDVNENQLSLLEVN